MKALKKINTNDIIRVFNLDGPAKLKDLYDVVAKINMVIEAHNDLIADRQWKPNLKPRSSVVEHPSDEREVAGSNPAGATNISKIDMPDLQEGDMVYYYDNATQFIWKSGMNTRDVSQIWRRTDVIDNIDRDIYSRLLEN